MLEVFKQCVKINFSPTKKRQSFGLFDFLVFQQSLCWRYFYDHPPPNPPSTIPLPHNQYYPAIKIKLLTSHTVTVVTSVPAALVFYT